MTVSLQTLMVPSREVELEFPGMEDMKVKLCYLAREELVKLRKKCVTTKFSRKTHKPEEVLDEDKFVKVYSSAVVKGWSGFKYKYLEELLLVDISSLEPEDEMEFTEDNLVLLMKNSDIFESWVSEEVGNLENFTKNK